MPNNPFCLSSIFPLSAKKKKRKIMDLREKPPTHHHHQPTSHDGTTPPIIPACHHESLILLVGEFSFTISISYNTCRESVGFSSLTVEVSKFQNPNLYPLVFTPHPYHCFPYLKEFRKKKSGSHERFGII